LTHQQQRLLERLRQAGDQPVGFAELYPAGLPSQQWSCPNSSQTDM
jgi:hypothetical protein